MPRVTPSGCPRCKKTLDGATPMCRGDVPEPGDYTVCAYCGVVLKWNSDMVLVLMNEEDFRQLSTEELVDISKASEVVKRFQGIRATRN
jgi:hypothetical protein